MAGLSQNVLNMKFMKGSDAKASPDNQPATYKKVKDPSEWFLPNRGQVQQRIKKAVKVKSVGYGSIASMTAEESESKKDDVPEEQPVPKKDPKQEADEFLKDIMGKPKKNKKRKAEKPEGGKPSKKSKKSDGDKSSKKSKNPKN